MNFVNLKRIARYKVKRETIPINELEEYLKDWWSEKFQLPNNHPLLLKKTLEELFIEYYIDIFRKNPEELYKFESEVGEQHSSSATADSEEWFKAAMGDQYTTKEAFSSTFRQELSSKEKTIFTKEEEFEDSYAADTLGQ